MEDNDNAQNFIIGGGSFAEGLVNNIIENLNGVHLYDNSEQGAPASNLKKPTESKVEISTPIEPTTSKRTSRMISSWMKNSSNEDGSSSAGVVVQNITSSEKTNDIVEKIENSKEVNPNEYEITEEKKPMIDCRKLIGCDIYKEFEGVKSLGTVTTYMASLKLFEVMYKNDSRLEYLNYNEVLSHLAEKNKIYNVQLVKPERNSLQVRIEFFREFARRFAALEKEATSKRKMKDSSIIERKSSSKKEKTSRGHSSNKAINIESARQFTKKKPETKCRPWHAKRENGTEEEPYEPYQFMGLYICKELNGIRSLGTVIGYCPEKNKLIIQYKTDDSIEYMTQLETLRSMAKHADIMPSPSASGSKKKSDKKKKNEDVEKASTSGTKKRTASGGPKV